MAHNIDVTNGQAAFLSAREDAWHGLGKTLDHSFTAEEAMEEGLLGGWDVRKVPLMAQVANDHRGTIRASVPGKHAVVRTNPVLGTPDVLGVVGDTYQVIQNEEHAELLNALVDESGAHFETAGAIDGGRRVFITMKMPGHLKLGGVDQVENYLAAVNSHDGESAFCLMVTPVRVVCQNTLNLAFGRARSTFRVHHKGGARANLAAQAREALDLTFNYLEGFQAEATRLIETEMTLRTFEKIVLREWGAPEDAARATQTRADAKVAEMVRLFEEADTQENIRGTAWAGLNAITEWADHFSPVRGDDRTTQRHQKALLDPRMKNRALELVRTAAGL